MAFASEAATVAIGFDNLQSGASYVEAGYHFGGQLTRDMNFGVAPSLRLHGNGEVTITRTDGELFSLTEFDLLYRYIDAPGWYIENQDGQGFSLSKVGSYLPGQYPQHTMQNVRLLRIRDSTTNSQNYYIFDRFVLSSEAGTSTVPEPSTLLCAALGLALFAAHRRASARFGV